MSDESQTLRPKCTKHPETPTWFDVSRHRWFCWCGASISDEALWWLSLSGAIK
jgi:hypothetical protein